MVKRVTQVTVGKLTVKGDNPDDSFDSRHFGAITAHQVVGKATLLARNRHSLISVATAAPEPTSFFGIWLPTFVATVTAVMVIGQLATYKDFSAAIRSYGLVSGASITALTVTIIVTELLSLPLLLRLPLSRLMRLLAVAAVIVTPLIWLILSISTLGSLIPLTNSGYLGSLIVVPSSTWSFLFSLIYFSLSCWCLLLLGGKRLVQKT